MKTLDKDRAKLKALMEQTAGNAATVTPTATAIAAIRPPPPTTRPMPSRTQTEGEAIPKIMWGKVTVRFTAGEIQKINDAVIATQQANRTAKVTTSDILRVALRRIKDNEAISASELKAVSGRNARATRNTV